MTPEEFSDSITKHGRALLGDYKTPGTFTKFCYTPPRMRGVSVVTGRDSGALGGFAARGVVYFEYTVDGSPEFVYELDGAIFEYTKEGGEGTEGWLMDFQSRHSFRVRFVSGVPTLQAKNGSSAISHATPYMDIELWESMLDDWLYIHLGRLCVTWMLDKYEEIMEVQRSCTSYEG